MAASVCEWIAETALRHTPERGPNFGAQLVAESIQKKKYDPRRDLQLRVLAETLMGKAFEAKLRAWGGRAGWVAEATEANDLSAFRSVMQANVAAVSDQVYEDSDSVTDQLLGMAPDEAGMDPMAPVRVPISGVATDPPRDVAPATDYPRTGFAPYYIEAPIADKVGLIAVCPLEWVKANQAKRFINEAAEVSRKVLVERRKRRLRVVLGITNNYKRNGTSYNTYLTSGDRVNKLTNFVIANGPAELDRLNQLFDAMTNPFTGEPMDVDVDTILTVRGNIFRLREMLNAPLERITSGSSEIEAPTPPFDFGGTVLTDRYVYNLLVAEGGLTAAKAATAVFMGDFQRAFKVREVEPFHTHEVGPMDEDWPPGFFQDIVYATKARFWETSYVADPFAVSMAYNDSAT